MPIPADSIIKSNIKNKLITEGFNLGNAPLTDKFVDAIVEEIMAAVKLATVTTSVAVTSAISLTGGPPGVGVGTGGLT